MVWGDGGGVRHLVQRRAGDDPGHQHAAGHRRAPLPGLPPGLRTRPTTPSWSATTAVRTHRLAGHRSGSSWPSATATRRWPSFRANTGYTPEEGESKAHTFHWIRNLAALGTGRHHGHRQPSAGRRCSARTASAPTWRRNITAAPLTVTLLRRHQRSPCPPGRPPPPGRTPGAAATRPAASTRPDRRPRTPTPTPTPTPTSPSPTPTSPTPPPTTPPAGSADQVPAARRRPRRGRHRDDDHGGRRRGRQPRRHADTTRWCSPPPGSTCTYTGGQTAFDLFARRRPVGRQRRAGPGLLRPDRRRHLRPGGDLPLLRHRPGPRLRALHPERRACTPATGTLGNLSGGTVKVEVWSAIGVNPSTLGIGNQSVLRLPYS